MTERASGTIKFFNSNKGYGFIRTADGGEVFVHASQLPDPEYEPEPGARVTFELATGGKGPRAMSVQYAVDSP